MATVSVGRILIAVSDKQPTSDKDFRLLEPANVPEWLKDVDVLGRMVQGHLAHDPAQGPEWYCAVRIVDKPANDELAESESAAILPAPAKHVEPAATPIILPENPEMH